MCLPEARAISQSQMLKLESKMTRSQNRGFLFSFDYLQFKEKECFISFSTSTQIPEFCCFIWSPHIYEPKKVLFGFLEEPQHKYDSPSFSYFIRLPSFQSQRMQNHFSQSIQKADYKAAVKDEALIGYHLASMEKLNKKRFPQDLS